MTKTATVEVGQRIPGHAVGECKAWQLPEVSGERIIYQARAADSEQQTLASRLTKFTAQGNVSPSQPTTRSRLTGAELEQLVASAEAEARERGYQEGLQQGTAAGQAAGLQQGLQSASEQLTALHATLDAINSRLLSVIDLHTIELQNAVMQLVRTIAGAVVQTELSVNSAALQNSVTTALAAISSADQAVTVFVSEQDYQTLTDQAVFEVRDWQLTQDPALVNGDCRILTRHASIDYTVAERLEQALAALYADVSSTDPAVIPPDS